MDKKIKESKRGLTFSFTPTETMRIGEEKRRKCNGNG